jgi:DNA-binding response OmpR family regulator
MGVSEVVQIPQRERMSKRILVIEKSRTIQTLLSTYFNNAGHRVITCSAIQEALHTLARLDAAPDLIFLAMDEKKEAYKVISYIKEHEAYAVTHLVGMGNQEEQAVLQRTLSASQMSYLVKPFHIQDAMALVSAPTFGAAAFPGIHPKA